MVRCTSSRYALVSTCSCRMRRPLYRSKLSLSYLATTCICTGARAPRSPHATHTARYITKHGMVHSQIDTQPHGAGCKLPTAASAHTSAHRMERSSRMRAGSMHTRRAKPTCINSSTRLAAQRPCEPHVRLAPSHAQGRARALPRHALSRTCPNWAVPSQTPAAAKSCPRA